MRITRRRERRPDMLANRERVREILADLRALLPDIMPRSEKQTIAMLRATRHIERYPATDTKRGRRSIWNRTDLLKVGSGVRHVLEQHTGGRISLASFVDHYLRALDFTPDMIDALEKGTINLFEAEQLSRLTPARLNVTAAEARAKRLEVLQAHLLSKGSATRLRMRIREMLGETPINQAASPALTEDELEFLDPSDTSHLFYDEMRRLLAALRDIRPDDLTDDILEELLRASDHLNTVLARVIRRRTPQPVETNRSTAKLVI